MLSDSIFKICPEHTSDMIRKGVSPLLCYLVYNSANELEWEYQKEEIVFLKTTSFPSTRDMSWIIVEDQKFLNKTWSEKPNFQ